jgi:surface protein
VEPKTCPVNVTFFETQVRIPLYVACELSPEVKRAIEREFEDRYNALTEQYCDPLFRTILNVTFIEVEGEGTDTLVVIAVEGRCRGCPEDSDLFDPSGGRRFLLSGETTLTTNQPGGVASGRKVEIGGHSSSFLRGLQIEVLADEEEICYCVATPVADRAAGGDEIFDDFEQAIRDLNDPCVIAPTDPPSAAPSDMPSGSPTSRPTRAPTPKPTRRPTPSPTRRPTPLPTTAPPPTTVPSTAPSTSPRSSPSTYTPSTGPSTSPSTRPSTAPFKPKDNGEDLPLAVGDWNSDPAAAAMEYGLINSWDTSLITDMSLLFDSGTFNDDISNWNVEAVTDMGQMFAYASDFNQDISNWNTAAVTNMGQMFWFASSFDKDLSNWNVEAVTDMVQMFDGASSFTQELCWTLNAGVDTTNIFRNSGGSFDSACVPVVVSPP